MVKWIGGVVLALAALGAGYFFLVAPSSVDDKLNAVIPHEAYKISDAAKTLHATIPVADLHADTLLWARDPARRHKRGHTDAPRLIEGGVRLQVFTAVTKSPPGQNYEENEADKDQLTQLMVAQRWPVRTWGSLFGRALYQAARLRELEKMSNGAVRMTLNRADLQAAIDNNQLAGVYGIEGAHPLEGDIGNLDRLYDAGLRVIGLQHFFDNALGGSLHGMSNQGLTDFGRAVVAAAEEKQMIVDVAHSSEATVRDVLAMTTRPVIVSHTGLKGHCDSARNISDDLMVEIADAGGLIGVGYWDGAVCEPTMENIAAAIHYAVGLVGAGHVALGSDFDGSTTVPFDASELPALTQALMDEGLDDETIRAVMGENAVRFFLENLPQN